MLPLSIRDFIISIYTFYRDKYFPASKVFGVKKGSYIYHYSRLKEIFPKAKFIGIIRDGRAVFNSKKQSIYSGTGKPFEINPYRAAKEWCKKLRMLQEIKNTYKETLVIYYEKMIQNPIKTVKIACDFLGISSQIGNISNNKKYFVSNRYGDLHKNIGKEALTSRISEWKNALSFDEIFAFESVAYNELLSEGYEIVNSHKSLKNVTDRMRTRLKFIGK